MLTDERILELFNEWFRREKGGDTYADCWNACARAIEAEVEAEAQEPIKLLDSVKAFIQDAINDATQCDDADADHDFALSLGQLLNPLYAAPQPPALCPKCEGRANGTMVAMPSSELKKMQAKVAAQAALIEMARPLAEEILEIALPGEEEYGIAERFLAASQKGGAK